MIVTVTANPALDLTYSLPEQADGEMDVHRATSSTLEASGKGVNVSRALARVGVPTCAVLPAGGPTGHTLVGLLDDDGVAHRITRQEGVTRINTTALQPGAATWKLNGPGATLTDDEQDGLLRDTAVVLEDARRTATTPVWLAVCGSLPPAVGTRLIVDLVEVAHRYGAKCVVDASGQALAAAMGAGADLLAPNRFELAEVDRTIPVSGSIEDLADAARTLSATAGTTLLISLGSAGALYVDGPRALYGRGPALTPVNTAGAGDALLAGWLSADAEPGVRLSRAISWSRSACLAATTVDPNPGGRDAATITVVELTTAPTP